jgi:ATP-binding cassette subfamily F protein uup
MSLIRFDNITLEFGDQKILTNASFSLEPGERVCLIGRNGAGKSTMLKLIMAEQQQDSGEMHFKRHLRISQLYQQLPKDLHRKVEDVVAEGLAEQQAKIDEFNKCAETAADEKSLLVLQNIQQDIEATGGWNLEQKIETMMTQLGLPANKKLSELSGGWQRRVALGKALVSKPDVLLLDEPTNHLDISTIEWLEHMIRGFQGSVVFITHDRSFLQIIATRFVDIDRGHLVSWPGNYQNYLSLKDKANEEEDTQNKLFDKRLSEEEDWIRQGVKARRTRNEGRVRALESMREEYGHRLKRQGKAKFEIGESTEKSGRKVIEARSVTHSFGKEKLIENFKLKVMRGDRIGLIGNNGVGKSTLLKILLGELTPDEGNVKIGTGLKIGYFDQIHRELDTTKSVAHNVGNGKEYIKINGKERHIVGYMRNFLFSPKRAMTPVAALSGGERNRVLLAKMFTEETNFLILDEPTNDLDVEMLEVLEEQLVNYAGTLVVVSHDRDFLDNVVTSTLVFEDNGKVEHYVGGYSDWAKQNKGLRDQDGSLTIKKPGSNNVDSQIAKAPKKKKLSYKIQRELDMLPGKIEGLEEQIKVLEMAMADADFYKKSATDSQAVIAQLASSSGELNNALDRWTELEG